MNNGTELLAISVRQPWAWLILHAGKDIENRSWPTSVRGPVWIHAAKNCTKAEWERAEDWLACNWRIELPPLTVLPRGGIVGRVNIVDCLKPSQYVDGLTLDPMRNNWHESGSFGFVLRDPKPVPFIPCSGRLGFFRPEIGVNQHP